MRNCKLFAVDYLDEILIIQHKSKGEETYSPDDINGIFIDSINIIDSNRKIYW